MKIYFAGSIRGGRNDVDLYLQIIEHLKQYGEVLTEHVGNKKLTDQLVREILGFQSIEDLAQAINESKISIKEVSGLKPVFRLHPPKGGFRNKVNKAYPKGALGYRGENIKELISRMV